MNGFQCQMGGYAEWLSETTCLLVELQVLGRKFQSVAMFF